MQFSSKTKINRKSPWSGKGILSFGRHFSDGIKLKKCLWIPDNSAGSFVIRSITGNFLQNQLYGSVVIQYSNETSLLGRAYNNKLVGPRRLFHNKGQLETLSSGKYTNVYNVNLWVPLVFLSSK